MIEVSELKEWLEIADSDSAYDGLLLSLEERAVAFVEAQTDRYFRAPVDVTEFHTGRGWPILTLSAIANVAPTTVTERPYPGGTDTVITASADDGFVVRPGTRMTRLIRKNGLAWIDCYEYEITFKRGYTTGQEPGDIRQLVIDLVSLKFGLRDSAGGGIQSESIGGYSYRTGDFSRADLDAIPTAGETVRLWRGLVYA
jgi:hypothetical protein